MGFIADCDCDSRFAVWAHVCKVFVPKHGANCVVEWSFTPDNRCDNHKSISAVEIYGGRRCCCWGFSALLDRICVDSGAEKKMWEQFKAAWVVAAHVARLDSVNRTSSCERVVVDWCHAGAHELRLRAVSHSGNVVHG
jgi:hypothetical protein